MKAKYQLGQEVYFIHEDIMTYSQVHTCQVTKTKISNIFLTPSNKNRYHGYGVSESVSEDEIFLTKLEAFKYLRRHVL